MPISASFELETVKDKVRLFSAKRFYDHSASGVDFRQASECCICLAAYLAVHQGHDGK